MADTSEIQGSLVPLQRQQAQILLEAGYLWMEMGKYDNAKVVLQGAAALMPKSEVPHLALGTLEFSQGHHDKALQAYRSAQKLAPRASLPRAHAGEALMFMGKANEALKELKAAVEIEPDSDGARFAQALIEAKDSGALSPKVGAKK